MVVSSVVTAPVSGSGAEVLVVVSVVLPDESVVVDVVEVEPSVFSVVSVEVVCE